MQKVSNNVVINILESDWDQYIDQLISFSPSEKEKFLKKQGINNMVDFVVHIVGWWQETMRIIDTVPKQPTYKPPDVDVDEYNNKSYANYVRAVRAF